MSKHLLIQYGDVTLYSGPVERFSFTESDSGTIEVKGGPERSGGAANMFQQLAKRAKETQPAIDGSAHD